ncbi:hypothetical protein LTR56_004138 [Elasticomyces elasticus]|nr:hypothetical protein LTR22_015343 [Elasticomyces elasticus]KAK3654084.1 hypothetical protein LTR56_004138 [Elasticomyces elasticus]KAK4914662.1 hypothetical protein LTR49_017104 [Elasticomyces elasticus]KAK5753025.1 hypothetical protein LTS12_016901 [Elasticomyces elasticus]
MNQPNYVLVPPLAGKDADPRKWLGKFVRSMDRPRDQYAPDELVTALTQKYILEPVEDLDATIVTRCVRDSRVRVKLTDILTFDNTTHSDKTVRLETPHVATWSLRQHDKVFNDLMADENVRAQTVQLLRAGNKRAFMIVGIKIVHDGSIGLVSDTTKHDETKIKPPIAEIAAASAGILPPSGISKADAEVEVTNTTTTNVERSHRFEGARIFAFEYKKVMMKKWTMRRVSAGPTMSLDIPAFDWRALVFSSESGVEGKPSDVKPSTNDVTTERPGLVNSPIEAADIGEYGIGWQTDVMNESVEDRVILHYGVEE